MTAILNLPTQVQAAPTPRLRHHFVLWVLAMTLLGAGLRVYGLGEPSFWRDELATVCDIADPERKHWSRMLGYLPSAASLWLSGVEVGQLEPDKPEHWRAMGVTERVTRAGSCVVGIVTVLLLGLASRRIMSARAAGVLALLLAVGTWHIYWSQTARFYSLEFLFFNLSLIGYFDATRRGSSGLLLGAIGCLGLAFLSHWLAMILCGVFAVDWAVCRWRGEPVRLGAVGWAAAGATLAGTGAIVGYLWFTQPWGFNFFLNVTGQSPTKLLAGMVYMIGPALVLFALVAAWLVRRQDMRLSVYLLLGAVLPPVGLMGLAAAGLYSHMRYGFVCYYSWLALAALGIDWLHRRLRPYGRVAAWAPLIALLGPVLLADAVYYQSGGGYNPPWREAFAYVQAHRQPGDQVYFDQDPPYTARYYLASGAVQPRFPVEPAELRDDRQRAWLVLRAGHAGVAPRLHRWLDEVASLEAVYVLRLAQPFTTVRVYLYEPDNAVPGGTAIQGERSYDGEELRTASATRTQRGDTTAEFSNEWSSP